MKSESIELARRYAYGVFIEQIVDMECIKFEFEKTREAKIKILDV